MRVVSTMRHLSSRNRWILTGTVEAQSANPSFTVTMPLATRCLRRSSVIVRAWIVGSITVKAVALVAVPPGVVTPIGPVVPAPSQEFRSGGVVDVPELVDGTP